MAVAFWIGVDPQVRDPYIVKWQYAIGQEVLIAIGTSILASTLFYLLYSRTAEDRVLREVSTHVTRAATEYATSLFQQRFDKMMPTKFIPKQRHPQKISITTLMKSFEVRRHISIKEMRQVTRLLDFICFAKKDFFQIRKSSCYYSTLGRLTFLKIGLKLNWQVGLTVKPI